jgi:predicted amidophosphoribosyltransferase
MTRRVGDTGTGPRRLLDGVVDLFLPRRCVECGATGAWLCPDCAARLRELTGPRCRRCGRPTPEPVRGCIECRGRDLAFVSAAAAFSYEGPARSLVKACKFRKLRSVVADMAALAGPRFAQVCSAGGEQMPFDVVTWVPTTAGRRLDRGFDQAQVFAQALAVGVGLAAAPLLQRTRAAGKQSDLDRVGRAGNVHGAFVCTRPAVSAAVSAAMSSGRPGPSGSGASSAMGGAPASAQVTAAGVHTTCVPRVLIIDDVYTTGETLNECATALSVAGYEPHVFTFARTVRGHPA